MSDVIVIILTGCGAAAVSGIFTLLSQHFQRKAEKNSKKDSKLDAVVKAVRLTMLDRIMYLGLKYIADEEVRHDNLRLLNEMHKVYHDDLDGNGDLDDVMTRVRKLPLKRENEY